MKHLWKWFAVSLLVIGLLAGCGTAEDSDTDNSAEPESEQSDESTATTDENETTTEESSDTESAETNDQASEEKTAEGTFSGKADNHTIEVKLEDGAQAFQITEEIQEQIKDLEPDTKISFTYVNKNGAPTITKLQVKQ